MRDVRSALARLERAVENLASTASDALAGRAASFIDEAADRLEREFGAHRPQAGRRHHHHRGNERHWAFDRPRSKRLYRDAERGKIVGVCAGIANYFGAEPWFIRCIAVTGLLFLPQVSFPAYWVLYFVMKKAPQTDAPQGKRRSRPSAAPAGQAFEAPELCVKLSPRRSLRNVQADLMQAELRLRRMEAHVTSGQYELHRAFNEIDGEAARS